MISWSRSDIRISIVWSGSLLMGLEKSFSVYMYQQSLLRLPMQYAAMYTIVRQIFSKYLRSI